MTTSVSLSNYTPVKRSSNRAHRVDVHRHADAYLENLEKIAQSEKLNKTSIKPGFISNYLSNFAEGLEMMFKTFHLKP